VRLFADSDLGAGCLLQRRQSARVVEVRVRAEQLFDVPCVEAEFGGARLIGAVPG